MLILALLGLGMLVGWLAQLILGRPYDKIDYSLAFVAGIGGSFVGGLIASLLAGDGLAIRPSGIIGSLVGAIVITAGWQWYRKRRDEKEAAEAARKPWEKT